MWLRYVEDGEKESQSGKSSSWNGLDPDVVRPTQSRREASHCRFLSVRGHCLSWMTCALFEAWAFKFFKYLLIVITFVQFFLSNLSPNMGLKFTALRSRFACSRDWIAPVLLHFYVVPWVISSTSVISTIIYMPTTPRSVLLPISLSWVQIQLPTEIFPLVYI